ncbi:hypothetical protein [Candidatus Nitrososphaera sp. FF02]
MQDDTVTMRRRDGIQKERAKVSEGQVHAARCGSR